MTDISPHILKDLAPTGKVRAAINQGNGVLVQRDPAGGRPRGITIELADELGRRLGVPVELVLFDAAGEVFAALKDNRWDVAFLAVEPVRAAEIEFTSPYVLIEGAYMVRKDSPLKEIGDVDRSGVRIAVGNNRPTISISPGRSRTPRSCAPRPAAAGPPSTCSSTRTWRSRPACASRSWNTRRPIPTCG